MVTISGNAITGERCGVRVEPLDADDFYEEDEPVEKIRAILARPPDGVTTRPEA